MTRERENQAFIDGQNLFLGTTKADNPWEVDLARLRIYLKDKYSVAYAYYFLGYRLPEKEDMYTAIQKAGYILRFREHHNTMIGRKKGNVDTDIVFHIMRNMYLGAVVHTDMDKVILVSGDGDYSRMVKFLIQEQRFAILLVPGRSNMSSLYKQIPDIYRDFLDRPDIKKKIAHKNAGSP